VGLCWESALAALREDLKVGTVHVCAFIGHLNVHYTSVDAFQIMSMRLDRTAKQHMSKHGCVRTGRNQSACKAFRCSTVGAPASDDSGGAGEVRIMAARMKG
jgi:hypothetical protein